MSEQDTRTVLDALTDRIWQKIHQLEHYRENHCQLEHARTIAEGRLLQANQILHWVAEVAIAHSPAERGGGKS